MNSKSISNSTTNLLQNMETPVKLVNKNKDAYSTSSTNLFLNLESPLKMDAMKNLVNKKNSNVNSRKLDEDSPDKINRERRTLEETPRETPRTSIDPL